MLEKLQDVIFITIAIIIIIFLIIIRIVFQKKGE